MECIILIDKPLGITSMGVIRVLRKKLGIKKIGHAGTLDPNASGLLVVGITRKGTKQLAKLILDDKQYITTIDLTKQSPTGDMESDSIETITFDDNNTPTEEDVINILKQFIGTIEQTPPIYSAIKIKGKKACELARKGIDVKMKPRNVKIHDIKLLDYDFPLVTISVSCSKGTYIRTLGEDIGKKLGLTGCLTELRRVKSGKYHVKNAYPLDKVTPDILSL